MSKLDITFEISEIIAARVAAFPRDALIAPEGGALPLLADMTGVIGIRPDGTLVEWSHDGGGRDVLPVEDRTWTMIALFAAARRYPEFEALLPAHRPGAVACACRRIPSHVSGLIHCVHCGAMGQLSTGDARPLGWSDRPRRSSSINGVVLVALAFASFYGAYVILSGPSRGYVWNGLALFALGVLSLVLSSRGVGRGRPRSRRAGRGPAFAADDPEVAALPPTSMTQLSEQLRQARERQRHARTDEEGSSEGG